MRNAYTVKSATTVQTLIGLSVLTIGALVYILDRPADQAPIFNFLNSSGSSGKFFGISGLSFPTFSHVFAFSLFTVALLGARRTAALWVCLGWLVLDAGFELGQHSMAAGLISPLIPAWFTTVPILNQAGAFFVLGTFDVFDLLSIALGTLAAYGVIRLTAAEECQ